ncbi:MAG: hypothetical protein ACR2G3_10350 [Solirubrobacterales bacterium]
MVGGRKGRMRHAVRMVGIVVLLAGAAGPALPASAGASTASAEDRYSLVHGCFALRSVSRDQYVAKSGNGYTATAASPAAAEPFRMQATDLGKYLLYGAAEDFLAVDTTPVIGGVVSAEEPSDTAEWTVVSSGEGFTLVTGNRQLSVDGTGELVAVNRAGSAGVFAFEERSGCATYPEVELNVSGAPTTGSPPFGEVTGLLDAHMHQMAFEFLGGRAHCGRPWHKFGAPYALVDCPDHEVGNGCGAILENFLWGNPPVRCHDPVGWPTFKDWPHPRSLTHEQSYYKWLERSWRGGQRLFVNLLVENSVLCNVYPLKKNSCNEMDSVLLQAQRMQELQDYIDAQSGGPGEGWFRIVRNPFRARRVINRGKLAVVMGMEVSEPFNCGFKKVGPTEIPNCDEASIDSWLDRLHDLGVRQLEITNKFDNALSGIAGDDGNTGTLINAANFLQTGTFWDLEPCADPENYDRSPTDTGLPHNDDELIANGLDELGIVVPDYEDGPLCNQRGLSDLGEHALNTIMDKGMVFDPDHMSVIARDRAMTLVEEAEYGGLISSHSWSTPNTLPRLYRLGGVITPYARGSEGFYHQWQALDALRGKFGRDYFGVGWGADMNGFGSQGLPRGADAPNPVTYPFQSFDGNVTIDKQISGQRTYDVNVDGVAHYGLYPDWLRDVENVAGADGDQIIEDMGRGAEAYLQMWERARGIEGVQCGGWGERDFTPLGLGDRLRLFANPKPTLKRAGQPEDRTITWTWCANPDDQSKRVKAVFTDGGNIAAILSTLEQHAIGGAAPGDRTRKLPADATAAGPGLWTAPAGRGGRYVFVTEGRRIVATGIVLRSVASDPAKLAGYVERAELP